MKKTLLSLIISGLFVGFTANTVYAQCPVVPFAVVELFTSQGCSSCPTGELMLSNVVNAEKNSGRNVICIAEHVTYWDYLGWTDKYGNSLFGTRQNSYVSTSGIGVKGTPQFFVNGKTNVTSSGALSNSINNYLGSGNQATAGVCLTLQSGINDPTLTVGYTVSGSYTGSNLIVVLTEDDRIDVPTAGENKNVTLHQDAVTRNFIITPLTGSTGTVSITPPANCVRSKSKIVAYIQAPLTSSSSNSTIKGATKGIDLGNVSTGVSSNNLEAGLNVYPNPAINDLYINYVNANVQSDVEVTVVDLSGRVVYTENIANNGNGEFAKNIDISTFAKGVYIVKVKADNEIVNKKIVIQ